MTPSIAFRSDLRFWLRNRRDVVPLRITPDAVLLNGKKGDIINQYIVFTQVFAEQIEIYGKTLKAVKETIRICKERNVLKEYLESRESEVITIMNSLFDQE